jgi:hypothetical protein
LSQGVSNGIGVSGVANSGQSAKAIYGESVEGYAGWFHGRVYVNGTLNSPGFVADGQSVFNGPVQINGQSVLNGPVQVNGTLKATDLPFGDYRNVQWDIATGQFYHDNSSSRHKENITPLKDDFAKLLQAEPKTYTRPGAPDRHEIGFIAEEFHDLGLTRLVDYGQDGATPEGINYEKISLYLTAIARGQEDRLQTQEAHLKSLEAENKELKGRIDMLAAAVERLTVTHK